MLPSSRQWLACASVPLLLLLAILLCSTSAAGFPQFAALQQHGGSMMGSHTLQRLATNIGRATAGARHKISAAAAGASHPRAPSSRKLHSILSTVDTIVNVPASVSVSANNFQRVPDAAHPFEAPAATDIRGPCPGLNAAANHGYLPRDGIVTFDNLVAAQQQVFNVGVDLAVVLAALAVALDGDIITEKVSIGRADPARTNALGVVGNVLGDEGGFNHHNSFEGDTSLTRNDYYLSPTNDDFSFNGTLYAQMKAVAAKHDGLYSFDTMAEYRYMRYLDSRARNPNFYYGPKVTLLYGAAAFLYHLMPNATGVAGQGIPREAEISSFFGAQWNDTLNNGAGGYQGVPERVPDNWFTRTTPYTLADVLTDLNLMYLAYPAILGGNAGVGHFTPSVQGTLSTGSDQASRNALACLLYQAVLDDVPTQFSNVAITPLKVVNFLTTKLNPQFAQFGCQH